MGATVSREDVIKMMKSVVTVSTDIYPSSYKTDSVLLTIIYPFLAEHNISAENGVVHAEMSYNTLLKCIDDTYGIKNYLKEFNKYFKPEEGIEKNYKRLIEKYSSIEILLLFGVFQNLVYVEFNIYLDDDKRPAREKLVTTMKLPDIRIEVMTVKLRDYCDQNMTDIINKYILTSTNVEDNVMSKKNVFMTDTISDFFDILKTMCSILDDGELMDALFELFSFLNIDELNTCALLIITDWPVL